MRSSPPLTSFLLCVAFGPVAGAQDLTAYEGFDDYAAGVQLESGSNGSAGTPVDGGLGWAGPYDVNNAIKSLVRAENRLANPVVYANGEVAIHGGNRALRLYDIANGAYVLQRQLSVSYAAAAGESLWFSFLFRTNNASPLANRDYLHIGFDDNAQGQNGNPRVGIGVTTVESTFPPSQPFQFFAKSTVENANTAFTGVDVAISTTYLLVGRIATSADTGTYDIVDIFLNPSSVTDPGPPTATATADSGLAMLTHFFLRTSGLDSGDAYVMDEFRIGRRYEAVVGPPPLELRFTDDPLGTTVRWSALLDGVEFQASSSLQAGHWAVVPGTFQIEVTERVFRLPEQPGDRLFFRLWQP